MEIDIIVKRALQTGILFSFVLIAFNLGQIQSYYNIDYYNQVCGKGQIYSNSQMDGFSLFLSAVNIDAFNKSVPLPNEKFNVEDGNIRFISNDSL
jgi:hypothetical protein